MSPIFPALVPHAADAGPQVPVTVLTGFLGSGKTTLLNRLLRLPDLEGVAVVINEFGAVGLDHDLVDHAQEDMVLLANGCICCTIRGDLVGAFERLADSPAARQGRLRHVVLETTGLADPAPILHTLMGDLRVSRRWRLAGVACTVDAVNGMGTLDRQRESVKQVAVADELLVTKTDLADGAALDGLLARLRTINPTASISRADQDALESLRGLLDRSPCAVREIVDPDYQPLSFRPVPAPHHHAVHDDGVRTHSIVRDQPLPREGFLAWLDLVASMRGDDLLRVKGLVNLSDSPEGPTVIHGVQHVFHPPELLDHWPSDDRRTRIVFITRDIDVASLEETLNVLTRRRRRRPEQPVTVPLPRDT